MTAPPDLAKLVGQFRALRDKIEEVRKAHAEALKPFLDVKEVLSAQLLAALDATNAESVRTAHGTVYKTTKDSATVRDAEAFKTFIFNTGSIDLADLRANAPAVREWIAEHGVVPPGVNFTTRTDVGVRSA